VKLKREVAALERAVFVKEKEHEQDSVVKIQLGKRLEQVLLDKEEAYEELEQLQVLYLYSATPTNSTLPLPHVASTYCSLSFRKYVQHHLTALTIPFSRLQIKLSTLKSAMSNMDFRVTAAVAASPAKSSPAKK
jgi:hypothetical protein